MNRNAKDSSGEASSRAGAMVADDARFSEEDRRFERTAGVANILLWPMLALLFATHLKITSEHSWTTVLLMGAAIWLPWLVLAPLTMALVRHWCQDRHHMVMDVMAWAAGMVVCVGTYAVVVETGMDAIREKTRELRRPPPMPRREPPPPRPPMFLPQVMGALPVYLSITAFAAMSVARRRVRERERQVLQATAELHRSRLELLYAQLRPHFLFNALNTIASLVHKEPDVVDGIVTSLGVLLHETLESDVNREVTLKHEIELVEMYLNIERARFGESLKLKTDLPEDCMRLMVPVLILQPVVENAVRHGLGPKKGHGTIAISATRSVASGRLRLVVKDDGVGIKEPLRNGIGLDNTRARLRAAYGDAGESVTVVPGEDGGSIAIMEIPQQWSS